MTVLRRRLLVALIVGVPLIFLPGVSLDVFNVPKLSLLAVGIGLMLFLWAVEIARSGRLPVGSAAIVPVVALVVPLLISWATSEHRGWAVWGEHGRSSGLISYLLVGMLALMVADAFRDRVRTLIVAVGLSGSAVAAYLVFQSVGLDVVWQPGDSPLYPPSTIGHFNFSGGFVALTVPAVLWLWLSESGPVRYAWAAATAIHGCAVIVSFSQGAWAASVTAASITLAYATARRRPMVRKAAWCVVMATGIAMVVSIALSGFLDFGAIATARTRAVLWESALEMAGERPLVGHGPNTYLLLGDGHRSVEEGLSTEALRADDPHSVPFAMLGNGGILALVGFVMIATWALRSLIRGDRSNGPGIALLGCVVAYLIQALVSVDVPAIRVVFWSIVGGIAAHVADAAPLVVSSRFRPVVAIPVGLIGVALAVAAVPYYLVPDIRMEKASTLLAAGELDEAVSIARDAVSYRDEPDYRVLLIDAYGFLARDEGTEGARYLSGVKANSAFLEEIPYSLGHYAAGHAIHQWAYFDPSLEGQALEHFEAALRLNPSDVPARVEAAETLIALRRTDDALDLLEPAVEVSEGRYPELWGIYAMALMIDGDLGGGREAVEATFGAGCRPLLSEELLRLLATDSPAPPTASFLATTGFACTRGEMYFFTRIVPERFRRHYAPE